MKYEYPEGFEEELKVRFYYDPTTGEIFRLVPSNGEPARQLINSRHPNGQLLCTITFAGKQHIIGGARIAYFLQIGRWPSKVKYIDGNNRNLKWENLTEQKMDGLLRASNNIKSQVVMKPAQVGPRSSEMPTRPIVSSHTIVKTEPRSLSVRTSASPFSTDDAVKNFQKIHEQEQADKFKVLKHVPYFLELATVMREAAIRDKRNRQAIGLWTGCTMGDAIVFLDNRQKETGQELHPEEYLELMRNAKNAGDWLTMDKVVHDEIQVGAWIHFTNRRIMTTEEIEQLLSVYTWNNQPVAGPANVVELAQAALLAKHGFKSEQEALALAGKLYGEEQERLRQLEEKAS